MWPIHGLTPNRSSVQLFEETNDCIDTDDVLGHKIRRIKTCKDEQSYNIMFADQGTCVTRINVSLTS